MPVKLLSANEFPELERSRVYQIHSPLVQEGAFYLALDPEREVVNVYCVQEDGKPSSLSRSNLFLRTLGEVAIDSSGTLVVKGKQAIYQTLRDWLGEEYSEVEELQEWDDGSLKWDSSLREIYDSQDSTSGLEKYYLDPYATTTPVKLTPEGEGDFSGSPLGDGPPPPESGEGDEEEEEENPA